MICLPETVKALEVSLNGVIGAMAIHQQTAEDRKKALPIDQLYVDVGAKDKDEALAKAPEGTPVTFATPYTPIGDGAILCKAADDRVGCYNMLRHPRRRERLCGFRLYLSGR